MQCYNRTFITRLGNRIGKTIKVDLLTPSKVPSASARIERGKYARICVELDLRKRLVSRVIAANTAYLVEYEGLNLICFECGRYGHRKESCQWTYVQQKMEQLASKSMVDPSVQIVKSSMVKQPPAEEKFGSWMIVGRGNKGRYSQRSTHSETGSDRSLAPCQGKPAAKMVTTSHFTALSELEEEDVVGKLESRKKEWVPVRVRPDQGASSTEEMKNKTRKETRD